MPENKRIIHQSAEQSNFKITILYPAKINIQYFHTVVRVYYCLALAGKKKKGLLKMYFTKMLMQRERVIYKIQNYVGN